MEISRKIEDYINSYKGVKKIVVKIWARINRPLIECIIGLQEELENTTNRLVDYENIKGNIRSLNGKQEELNRRLADYENVKENIRSLNAKQEELNRRLADYENVKENIRNLNVKQEELNRRLADYENIKENIRSINRQLEGYGNILINLRNNNNRLEKIDGSLDMCNVKISRIEKELKVKGKNEISSELSKEKEQGVAPVSKGEDYLYSEIDYFDFENYFRGSREQIKRNQMQYIKYFEGKRNVIDLGCGRGEFLELLQENGIEGYGVDIYQEFVDLCNAKNLKAICADALGTIENERQLGGIFAAQLIEHLEFGQIVKLAELAYEKLEEGAYLILETPNPSSLAIYSHAFYIDPSHNKPVHPLTMKYILEKAGFTEISILYTENSRRPVKIPQLTIQDNENIKEFNAAMKELENEVFGSQDYAIIARR